MPQKSRIFSLTTLSHVVLIGMAWFVFKGVLDVAVNTTMRILGESHGYHATQLVFFYSVMASAVYIPSFLRNPNAYKVTRWRIYIARGALEVGGFLLMILAVTRMPFATFTTLTFITPIFASLAAVLFLKEQMFLRKWAGLALGFSGILVVSQPNAAAFNNAVFLVMGGAACFAFCAISIRSLAKTDTPSSIAFISMGFMALFSLPLALMHWQMPTMEHAPYLLILAAFAGAVQFSVGKALQKVEVTTVQPLTFLTLIWSSAIGVMMFDESVSWSTILGAVLIIAGIIVSIRRNAKRSEPFITTQPLP